MSSPKTSDLIPSPDEINSFHIEFDRMKTRVYRAEVVPAPHPHIFIEDFVSKPIYRKLVSSVPPASSFKRIEGGGYICPVDQFYNYSWNMYDSLMRLLMWSVLPKFQPWIEEKEKDLRDIGMSCSCLRNYPSFISYADPSRGVPPHRDGTTSVLSALTVFGYPGGEPAPVTNYFRSNGDYFEPVTHYGPSSGSLFVWINLPDSWHGVVELVKPHRITHIVSLESYDVGDK